MSKGFVLFAHNTDTDYVQQACLCAMSILATNLESKISLITNDPVPKKYVPLFDNIIPIPWTKATDVSYYATEQRWKIYHASPYDETIVLDTDMLVLQDITQWWNFLANYNLYFTSNVYTYRDEKITDNWYRKAFVENNLPNLYCAFHYFKKGEFAHNFYKWVELVVNNWELFYGEYVSQHYPKHCSMDITVAVVAKILNCETKITNPIVKYPAFTHMKPKIQKWQNQSENWQSRVGTYLTSDLKLTIGNHLQSGIFHYAEDNFVNEDIIARYEKYLGVKDAK